MNCLVSKLFGRPLMAFLLCVGIASVIIVPIVVASRGSSVLTLPQEPTEFIRQIPLVTSDVVYNPSTKLLIVSTPSTAGVTGNSIISIDPVNGVADNAVFIGSEPKKLALADDNVSLYAWLEGSAAIRRFDLPTKTPGLQFPIGTHDFFGTYLLSDFAVAPGNPNLVAVARNYRGVSPPEAGVAVFDNGVQRPTTTPGHSAASDFLAFSASATTLYGGSFSSGLNTMTIDSSGVTVTNNATFISGNDIRFDNGLVYGSTGQVINPVTGSVLGTFAGVGSGPFTTDSAVGRAYFLTGSQSSSNYTVILRAFNINSFIPVGTLTISGVKGAVSSLVRWGSNGLAFRTDGGQLFLIQTTLIPSADPIPTPSPTPSPSPSPSPTPINTFVRKVPLVNNDIAYSSSTQKFYTSLPSSADGTGNSIQAIDPNTGATTAPVFIGSEPTKLAISDDGQTLYAALDGAAAIRRFNLISQMADIQFPIAIGNSFPIFANDIAVLPGNPNSVAVSRTNRISSPDSDGVAIYDNGVPRTKVAAVNSFAVETSTNANRLYSWGYGGVDRLAADASGVTVLANMQMINGGDIRFDNGLLYASGGGVLDPESGMMKGSFTGLGSNNESTMTTDSANGRAFFLTGQFGSATLQVFDLNTFVPLGTVTINIPNTSLVNPTRLTRWGTNGLAFRTASSVIFIQSSLVSSSGVVPPPGPSPTPTPSPSPTPYVPTFVRQLDLPANDLVYRQADQRIYASVPSIAGPNGNSITAINPATGAIGPSGFVGSEPNKLALSDNGNTLHVSLDGAGAIRIFDIPTLTAGIQFPWGTTTARPGDMAVVPGSPNSLAISDYTGVGVAIYDSGVRRANTSKGGAYAIGPLEFGATPTTLYGYDPATSSYELVKFIVDANGVDGSIIANNLINGGNIGFQFVNGRLYSASGRVVDPEAKTLLGTFRNPGFAPILVADPAINRVFYVARSGDSVILSAFDTNTFLPTGTVNLQGITGNPVTLVRWGTNGLAFNTVPSSGSSDVSRVYLIQSALVSTATPIPTGVQLSASSYSSFEGVGNVVITVLRTGDVSSPTTVDYTTSGGTASAGNDYTATSGTVTFSAGELSKTFSVPIINDTLYEGANETFNVTLSNPTAGVNLVSPSTAIVTIFDNDQKPTVSIGNVSLLEGNSGTKVFSFPVTLSNPSVQTVTVDYSTADSTALAGSDYVATSGTLVFTPGSVSNSINVTVNGDTLVEPTETFLVGLGNATNVSFIQGNQGIGTIQTDDNLIKFSATNYSVAEGAGFKSITVERTGETNQAVTVEYASSDHSDPADFLPCTSPGAGFASSRCDFTTAVGTLRMAAGETSKTFNVLISQDNYVEGPETLNLTLSNPSGGIVLGTPSTAVLEITDDASEPANNPIDNSSDFARQQYHDVLNREADAPGLAFWTDNIEKCNDPARRPAGQTAAQCIDKQRESTAVAFFMSPEFQMTGGFVYRLYKGSLTGVPNYDGGSPGSSLGRFPTALEFMRDVSQASEGIVVNNQISGALVEANRNRLAAEFVLRPEFVTKYGALNNTQYVQELFNTTGIVPTAGQRQTLINGLQFGSETRASVLRKVVDGTIVVSESNVQFTTTYGQAFYNQENRRLFVYLEYVGYLRRNPDSAGFIFWLGKLNQYNADPFAAEMVRSFILSPEYRSRFGQP
jgi:hypothetical protein